MAAARVQGNLHPPTSPLLGGDRERFVAAPGGSGDAGTVATPLPPPPRRAVAGEPPERRLPHVDATAAGTAIAGRVRCSKAAPQTEAVVPEVPNQGPGPLPEDEVVAAAPAIRDDVPVRSWERRDCSADTCWPTGSAPSGDTPRTDQTVDRQRDPGTWALSGIS